jgi:hypothetical protein
MWFAPRITARATVVLAAVTKKLILSASPGLLMGQAHRIHLAPGPTAVAT